MTKQTGEQVLHGTASINGGNRQTAVAERLIRSRPKRLAVILDGLKAGQRECLEAPISVTFSQNLGDLYPFTLRQKLEQITEPSAWYTSDETPWGRPIVPIEMISVLALSGSNQS